MVVVMVVVMLIMLLLLLVLIGWPRAVAIAVLLVRLLALLVMIPWTSTTAGASGPVGRTRFFKGGNDRGGGRCVRKVVMVLLRWLLLRGRMALRTLLLRRLVVLQGVRKGRGGRRRTRGDRIVVNPGTVRRGHYRRRV